MLSKSKKITYQDIESIGICCKCKKIISFTEIPKDSPGPFHSCPLCKKLMSPNETWGYGVPSGKDERLGYQRLYYVGPKGIWVSKRPKKDFTINRFRVLVKAALDDKRIGIIYSSTKKD